MRLLFLFIVFIGLNACTTQVTSLKQDQDVVSEANQGYLLLGIQTNRSLKSIEISGAQRIELSSKDVKRGTNYLLVDLKAGQYTIDRLLLDRSISVNLENEEYWQFEVVPGQISYVGHLELVTRGFSIFTSNRSELVNRSSEALEFLADNYPNIFSSRKITYSGPGDDSFFSYLNSLDEAEVAKE